MRKRRVVGASAMHDVDVDGCGAALWRRGAGVVRFRSRRGVVGREGASVDCGCCENVLSAPAARHRGRLYT